MFSGLGIKLQLTKDKFNCFNVLYTNLFWSICNLNRAICIYWYRMFLKYCLKFWKADFCIKTRKVFLRTRSKITYFFENVGAQHYVNIVTNDIIFRDNYYHRIKLCNSSSKAAFVKQQHNLDSLNSSNDYEFLCNGVRQHGIRHQFSRYDVISNIATSFWVPMAPKLGIIRNLLKASLILF